MLLLLALACASPLGWANGLPVVDCNGCRDADKFPQDFASYAYHHRWGSRDAGRGGIDKQLFDVRNLRGQTLRAVTTVNFKPAPRFVLNFELPKFPVSFSPQASQPDGTVVVQILKTTGEVVTSFVFTHVMPPKPVQEPTLEKIIEILRERLDRSEEILLRSGSFQYPRSSVGGSVWGERGRTPIVTIGPDYTSCASQLVCTYGFGM